MSAEFDLVRQKVTESFLKQTIMSTIGATIETIEPGEVTIKLPFKEGLSQQDGFIHAGVITTIVDSACGYAAMTLMPEDARVLTIEFKSNFASPAIGDFFIAKGKVIKPGRTIMIASGDVHAHKNVDNEAKLVSLMQASMMVINP
ncbi:PaaI family thioesterase [Cocleimonas flava]|uniref:Medium/long-chain acyl-CoA thioesterase YigI n=1 Tax=Cocleimonas flava TaxID=634765 RepID=A0A4R1F4E5_9GAMM|nr:PaaI family thioesterase [Cocleimonas flava]TCJ87502.1 uncharacterized protein (TIGR00369 family) [Cocleimonas flava]